MHENRDGEFLCTGIVARLCTGVVAIVVLQIIVRVLCPGESYLHLIVLCQSFSILFSALDLFVYWFRYNNKAELDAILRIITFLISTVWRIVVLAFGFDLIWYVVGTVLETALFTLSLLCFFTRRYEGVIRFSSVTLRNMLRKSYPFIISSIMTTVYTQADRIMLKSMMDASAVALYSVASHLGVAISMIPAALVEGFRADILEYKQKNEGLYKKRVRQLYCLVFWTSIMYCLFLTIFPEQVLRILYGEQYVAAANTLSLVVWFSTFAYFGSINNLCMVAEGKQRYVQITTLTGATVNVVLNFLLIPQFGTSGAAAASLLSQLFANGILLGIIKDLRPVSSLMLQGITFQDVDMKKLFAIFGKK